MKKMPKILTIAGFDPCSGAGISADIKTASAHGVYAIGAVSAITYQNDSEFFGLEWTSAEIIIKQLDVLFRKYFPNIVKIGIIENIDTLDSICSYLKDKNKDIKIIWDPVIKASAGFEFHEGLVYGKVKEILQNIYLITPNISEAKLIFGEYDEKALKDISAELNFNILIKSSKEDNDYIYDELFTKSKLFEIKTKKADALDKHGTGCALSTSIASMMALSKDLFEACRQAQNYVKSFLYSTDEKLGNHNI